MDEYYYYAAAIFLISVFSITTTVVDTRSVCSCGRGQSTKANTFADNASSKGDFSLRLRRPRPPQRLL